MTEVDDGDISITSTAPSEQLSEYEVETILTELEIDDGVLYLVKWAGYPVERSTWEPATSFFTEETFADWKKKKKAIAEGRQPAFDIANWEKHLVALDQARDQRKRKRQAKRRRLALSGFQTDSAKKQRVDASHPPTSSLENLSAVNNAGSGAPRTNLPVVRHQHLPTRPPMVMFGSSQRSAPWMAARHKKPDGPDSHGKSYTLSTKWRYEKAKGYEPPPDINQLELYRPSEWPRIPNSAPTPKIGNHPISSPSMGPSLPSPKERENPASTNDDFRRQNRIVNSFRPDHPNPRVSSGSQKHLSGIDRSRSDNSPTNDLWRPDEFTPTNPWRALDDTRSTVSNLNHFTSAEEHHATRSGTASDPHHGPELEEEPIPPLPPRRPVNIKGAKYRRAFEDVGNQSRFWNPGEIFLHMYLGPDKKLVGAVRLCGLGVQTRNRILQTKKGHRLELWFQEICTLDDYTDLCGRSTSNIRYGNGWVEGYDDTEPNVYRMGQKLRRGNLLAISYPEEGSHRNVLLAFSPFSGDFDFLWDNDISSPDTFLYITPRSSLPRLDKPSLFDEITRSSIPAHVEPQREQALIATEQSSTPIEPRTEDGPVDTQDDDRVCHDASHERGDRTAFDKLLSSNKEPLEGTRGQSPPQAQRAESNGPAPASETDTLEKAEQPLSVENFDVDIFFRDVFNVTFDILTTNNAMRKGHTEVFYLMCPLEDVSVEAECRVVVEFLKKHEAVTFSNRYPEDWEKFVRTMNRGVVLFHESFVNYDRMSNLKDLVQKSFTFWSFSLTGIGSGEDRTFFQRIFPHGGVILLTEDFMVHEPDATIILLAWFYDWTSKKFPGSWKIMLRPDVLNWLLRQPEPKEKARQGIWLVMYSLIIQLSTDGNGSCLPEDEVLNGIHDDFSDKRIIFPAKLPLYGSRTEDDCPELPKGLSQEERDTDHLAEFFAGWGLINSHRFRRFVVVTTLKPLSRWSAWNHVDVKESARDFFKAYGVDYKAYWSRLKSTGKSPSAPGDKKLSLPPAPEFPTSNFSPTIPRPFEGFTEPDSSKTWPPTGPSRL